ARKNARRSRVPGVGDDERARPLMHRAEKIAFVELSDVHNELVRSVVQRLLLRRTLLHRCSEARCDHDGPLHSVATDEGPKARDPKPTGCARLPAGALVM